MSRPVGSEAPADPIAHIDAILEEIDAVLAQQDLLNLDGKAKSGA
jgi:hypothetical protein